MPKITLHYMDFPFWRAEVARLALHLGKVRLFELLTPEIMTSKHLFRLSLKTTESRIGPLGWRRARRHTVRSQFWKSTERSLPRPEPLQGKKIDRHISSRGKSNGFLAASHNNLRPGGGCQKTKYAMRICVICSSRCTLGHPRQPKFLISSESFGPLKGAVGQLKKPLRR